jgi:phosphoserine phosphatase
MRHLVWILLVVSVAACAADTTSQAEDPLPSWNAGPARDAVIEFVERATTPGGEDFVPEPERIAVFDNDGTLWSEQPMYFQLRFAIDRLRAMAPDHPEWRENPVLSAVLDEDWGTVADAGVAGVLELVVATHAGITTEGFAASAAEWLSTARHPRFDRPYTELVYQPMLELLEYLRANGFQTWIVSGGGVEFLRVFAEQVYGIPPEQVIGSSVVTEFEMRTDGPVLVRRPEIGFIDDKEGKPVAINLHVGRRPLAAFGNSDGDLQMLQWTMAGDGPRFALYVHHTDDEREWAYDRASHIGRLDKGLDEAAQNGWIVVDMKRDWKVIYPERP